MLGADYMVVPVTRPGLEVVRGYRSELFREDPKKLYERAGLNDEQTTFLFNDTQIVYESMLEDINGILNSGDVPNLYAAEDMEAITTASSNVL